jgi:hypothetical protein
MRIHRSLVPALAALLLATAPIHAQGKSQGKGKAAPATPAAAQRDGKGPKKIPPGQAKKMSPDDAVTASRDVFTRNGYRVVRVETVGLNRVIYYRRGNNGNGKGQGPLMKMVVRPVNDVVEIETSDRESYPLADKIRAVLKF